MNDHLTHRVARVFQNQFRLTGEQLTDNLRRGQLEAWDSLSHVLLVDALNREFSIRIPPERALEIETHGDARRVVASLMGASKT